MCLNPALASVVWSDNFDDGDLTGWKISGASYAGRNLIELVVAPGNFSVADGALRETSAPKMLGYSYIARPNTVTKGTWSFDVFFSEEGTFNGVPVIFDLSDKDEVLKSTWMEWHGYEIRGSQSGTLSMSRLDRAMGNPFLHTNNTHSFSKTVNVWHHFDITYDGMGSFLVYVDNELCLNQTDTTVMSFNCFGFFMQAGTVIDNVVVRDDVIVPSKVVSTNSLKVFVGTRVARRSRMFLLPRLSSHLVRAH